MEKNSNEVADAAEQLLDVNTERPKEHILETPKLQPTQEEKKKAAGQREAIKRALNK